MSLCRLLTGGSRVSSSSYDPSVFSEVFYDTSVLLNYVLGQDDGESKGLLKDHSSDNYTGSTVEREFNDIKERREKVLKSIYACDDLSSWSPPSTIDMSPNDEGWCADLLHELDQLGSRDDIEDRLELEERKFKRGLDTLFEMNGKLIDTVWPNNLDAMLLSRISFIKNNNDRHVVCESADWACSSEADNLITTDENDLLDQRQRISDVVDQNRDLETLHIFSPSEFTSQDPDA